MVHGDAAFAGQGLVSEVLNLTSLRGYRTGGTVHVIVNNQIGFTTSPMESRSTPYATDVAKGIQVPIFHVNGDHPEAVAQVVRLAMDYRKAFHSDVVIDMYCYRKYGHNEADEPSFTQPLLYQKIEQHPSVRALYAQRARRQARHRRGRGRRHRRARAPKAQRGVRRQALVAAQARLRRRRLAGLSRRRRRGHARGADQGVARGARGDLDVHHDAARRLPPAPRRRQADGEPRRRWARAKRRSTGAWPSTWRSARWCAKGTWCACRARTRGAAPSAIATRSSSTSERRRSTCRSSTCRQTQAPCRIYDSPLSEAAVLGFEFGYSLDYPDALVAWEAQFGDFVNGAQVMIDQYISSAEDKWNRLSGLTCSCRTATKARGRSTRRRASSASWSSRPRTTCRSSIRRRRRSSSTSCGGRWCASCVSRSS